jgi:hypothetical protein
MASNEFKDVELNILIFGWNEGFKKIYEENFQKISS